MTRPTREADSRPAPAGRFAFGTEVVATMRIRIRYQRRGEPTLYEMELTPDEYFDPLDPDEALSVDSLPRLMDTYEYTPHPADELVWTVVEITDGTEYWIVRTQLLDGMRALMHHRQASDGSEEIIHSTEVSPGCWHTVRTLKESGKQWAVVVNSLTVEKPGRMEDSRGYCEWQTYEELKTFGAVR